MLALGVVTLVASNPSSTPSVAINPECAIHVVDFQNPPQADTALVSDRTDPTTNSGFTHFRRLGGPIGNPAVGFTQDVYGFNEAWLRNPSSPPVVFRAQAHPMRRTQFNDFKASAWSVTAENGSGAWSPPFASGTANPGQQEDDPIAGGLTTPQLMPVGKNTSEMFACAGALSDDGKIRTTSLFEFPDPAAGPPPNTVPIQDLLSGDDRFNPNISGPLSGNGHATAPTPNIHGPGNPVTEGAIRCAMVQSDDDVSTRELHMLAVNQGRLYYAMASNWSAATQWNGVQFNRFNTISQWSDVGQMLGGGFGNIVAAAIVTSQPLAVSVLFATQTSNGNFKLIHTVRFSPGGAWRAPDDVLVLNGATSPGPASGLGKSFQIGAGMCPAYQPPAPTQDPELVYVLWTDVDIFMGRHVTTARQWSPQLTGNYSPLFDISTLLSRSNDPSRTDVINSISVGARPFSDTATPSP